MSCDEFVGNLLEVKFWGLARANSVLSSTITSWQQWRAVEQGIRRALFSKGDTGLKLMGKIRVLSLRAGGFTTLRGMGKQFRILDKDKSKTLDRTEVSGLQMLTRAWLSRQGKVWPSLQSFDITEMDALTMKNSSRLRVAWTSVEGSIKMAFDSFEKDQWITLKVIAKHYDVSMHPGVLQGKMTPTEALYEFMKNGTKMATTQSQRTNLMSITSGSVPLSTMMTTSSSWLNAWHIGGGNGWMANSSCRRVLVTHMDGSQEIVEVKNDLGLGSDPEKIQMALMRQGSNIKSIKLTG